ncbi:MAG: hypothetical protein LBV33_02250, partial [Lachnospiraceae bacterium]|nr:hypothetical protein [Lachnospiraceae bacterium]
MRKILFTLLTVILSLSFGMIVFAGSSREEQNYFDDEPYVFTIIPETPEWKAFTSKAEKLAVSQIPEDKLANMTTRALLETVMNYPLITDYFAFNTVEDAYNTMFNDFNGFRELYNRTDSGMAIINEYRAARVLSATEALTAKPKEFFKPSTLEYLFACNEITKGNSFLRSSEYMLFKSIFAEKEQLRDAAGIYSSNSAIISKYESENRSPLLRDLDPDYTTIFNSIKTPKGTYVLSVCQTDDDLTGSEIALINNEYATSYPTAIRIAGPSNRYNCHSYAWHSTSTSNNYWIDYPFSYINDGSYYLVSGTPRSGMKLHYYNGDHSAISIGAKVINGAQTH